MDLPEILKTASSAGGLGLAGAFIWASFKKIVVWGYQLKDAREDHARDLIEMAARLAEMKADHRATVAEQKAEHTAGIAFERAQTKEWKEMAMRAYNTSARAVTVTDRAVGEMSKGSQGQG